MSVKSTKVEVLQRVGEVQQLLLDGHTRSFIIQYGSKWNITDRQIDDYIKMANDQVKEVNLATLQDNLGMIIGNLWQLFREARLKDNISEQHKILMSIAKLKGLDQMIINHVIEDRRELADMSDEELDQILSSSNELH